MQKSLPSAVALAICFAAALLAGAGITATVPRSGWISLLFLASLCGATLICASMPTDWIPAAALTSYVLIPQQMLGGGVGGGFPPSVALLVVWAVRRYLADQRGSPRGLALVVRLLGCIAVGWCLVLLLSGRNYAGQFSGWVWTASLGCALLAPTLCGSTSAERLMLLRTIRVLTTFAGSYALVETAIRTNPMTLVYAAAGNPIVQEWDGYRAHVTFGHPLYAGTYFATALAISAVLAARGSWSWLATSGFALVGLVCTISRGALIAAAIGILVMLLVIVFQRRLPNYPGYAVFVGGSALAIGVVLSTNLISDRVGSAEAERSSAAREKMITVVQVLSEKNGWLGYGPGSADAVMSAWTGYGLPAESSLLQLQLSLGLPGVVIFALISIALVGGALLRGDLLGGVPLLVFFVAISGYNAIETLLPLHALLGLLILMILKSQRSAFDACESAAARG